MGARTLCVCMRGDGAGSVLTTVVRGCYFQTRGVYASRHMVSLALIAPSRPARRRLSCYAHTTGTW